MLYIGCRLRGVFIRSVGGNAFPFFFGALSKLVLRNYLNTFPCFEY